MRGGKIRKLTVLVVIGAVVTAVLRSLRGESTPVFSNHPTVTGGPPTARPPAPPTSPRTQPTTEPAVEATPSAAPEQAWIDPIDGACPDGYPIKAKVKSGIFHQPGTPTYERTKPDRCYPSVEAAEADGLRAPKR